MRQPLLGAGFHLANCVDTLFDDSVDPAIVDELGPGSVSFSAAVETMSYLRVPYPIAISRSMTACSKYARP